MLDINERNQCGKVHSIKFPISTTNWKFFSFLFLFYILVKYIHSRTPQKYLVSVKQNDNSRKKNDKFYFKSIQATVQSRAQLAIYFDSNYNNYHDVLQLKINAIKTGSISFTMTMEVPNKYGICPDTPSAPLFLF